MLTPQIIVILFTRRLPYVQCSKNRLTCENYIAVYKIFQEHQVNSRRCPVFTGAISNSRRCPGVVYTQFYTLNGIPVTRSMHLSHNGNLKHRLHLSSITLWTLLTLPAGVCWAGSMKRNGVRPSVCPGWTHCSKTAAGGLLPPHRARDIDWLLQRERANAGSAALRAYVGCWTQICSFLTHQWLSKLTMYTRDTIMYIQNRVNTTAKAQSMLNAEN